MCIIGNDKNTSSEIITTDSMMSCNLSIRISAFMASDFFYHLPVVNAKELL